MMSKWHCFTVGDSRLVLEAGRSAKDQKLRELSLTVLARTGAADQQQLQAEIQAWLAASQPR